MFVLTGNLYGRISKSFHATSNRRDGSLPTILKQNMLIYLLYIIRSQLEFEIKYNRSLRSKDFGPNVLVLIWSNTMRLRLHGQCGSMATVLDSVVATGDIRMTN